MITEEMKVCIAAEPASVLKLRGGMEIYRRFESIEIFPEDLSKVSGRGVAGDANGRRAGQAGAGQGGMNDGEDGYNGNHEFTHIIDFASLDGKADACRSSTVIVRHVIGKICAQN